MKRVLGSGGHLVIGDAWAPPPWRQLANFSFRFSPSGDHKIYSRREMTAMFSATGFGRIDWQRAGYAFIVTAEA